MGVPAFFRWLSRKYSAIVVACHEEKPKNVDGTTIPINSADANPNNVEFDNLYLDMNGIIHPCCHPENKPAPKDEDEMMVLIFEYIERIFNIVRPRRLLYMAIDGVAPRAKMNQQRSRRFRASKESVEKALEISDVRNKLTEQGIEVPPEKPKEAHFDSNCITPGTPFMDRLAQCLDFFIHEKLNTDPGWKNIEVILSDANAPGEGEHKIMDYIRRQRASPDHDPNTHHCLCGADADLIMLGLATHEPNFTIIREEFKPNQPRPCELCGQVGHTLKECVGVAKIQEGEFDELSTPIGAETEFIFLKLSILREYLKKELDLPNLPFKYDFERAVDDWVFMCFFVGNDFLPHLPSLEIREGAIDKLVEIYKDTVRKTGGFITDSGFVEMSRIHMILQDLGKAEDEIFIKRQQNEIQFKNRQKRQKQQNANRPSWTPRGQYAPRGVAAPQVVLNPRQELYKQRLEAMKKVEEDEEPEDSVKLWEPGWKDRYYEVKFNVAANNLEFRYKVAEAYAEGLCWVLRYYYQGCASWDWYYPYHYAPFASDFITVDSLDIQFDPNTKPFNPLEQLMAVFPAASKQHLPDPWAKLMCEPNSSIIDFYPIDFKIDLNGKKFAWQGVALLPFVDEKRLLKGLEAVYPLLNGEEIRRNQRGDDKIYIHIDHPAGADLIDFYVTVNEDKNKQLEIDASKTNGLSGALLVSNFAVQQNETVPSPLAQLRPVPNNKAMCLSYRDPKFPVDYKFPAERLKGATDPPDVLGQKSFNNNNRNWRPQIGMAPATQRASLGPAGGRMINHHTNQYQSDNSSRHGNRHSNDSNRSYDRPNYSNSYQGQGQRTYDSTYNNNNNNSQSDSQQRKFYNPHYDSGNNNQRNSSLRGQSNYSGPHRNDHSSNPQRRFHPYGSSSSDRQDQNTQQRSYQSYSNPQPDRRAPYSGGPNDDNSNNNRGNSNRGSFWRGGGNNQRRGNFRGGRFE